MANNFRLNARKPKNNAGLATPKGEIYLLYREDIIAMPEKDKRGVLTTGDIIIKEGRRFHLLYTTPATQVHNRDTEGDVDSRGWKKKISGNYPGDELEINEFVKNNLNQGFIAVVKSCQSEFMKIYGSVNNPLYFTGSFVDDNERKGYELTFEQTFADEDPVLFYSGKILVDEDAFSESDPEFTSLFVKLDGSNITDENKEILKKKLDIGNLPPNIATIDKDDEVGNVYSKIESDANYLPKTTATITEPNAEFKYAYLTNEANQTRRMLAGDLGKNVANSKPTSVAGAGLNMGAIWDIETNGFPLRIRGLANKKSDPTHNLKVKMNANGQLSVSDEMDVVVNIPDKFNSTASIVSTTINVNHIFPTTIPERPSFADEVQNIMANYSSMEFTPLTPTISTRNNIALDVNKVENEYFKLEETTDLKTGASVGEVLASASFPISFPKDQNFIVKIEINASPSFTTNKLNASGVGLVRSTSPGQIDYGAVLVGGHSTFVGILGTNSVQVISGNVLIIIIKTGAVITTLLYRNSDNVFASQNANVELGNYEIKALLKHDGSVTYKTKIIGRASYKILN